MRKKTTFALLTLFLIVIISFCLCGFTSPKGNYDNLNPKDVELFATKWIAANYSEKSIGYRIEKVYNLDESLHSYYIIFQQNNNDEGYLLLNSYRYTENPILEYSFSGSLLNLENGKKLYYYDNGRYGYDSPTKKDNVHFDKTKYKKFKVKKEKTANGSPDLHNGIYNLSDSRELSLYGNFTFVKDDLEYTPYLMNYFGTGGICGPVAITNLAYLYTCMGKPMLYNNNINETYKKIVEYIGYERSVQTKDSIAGFKKYVKNHTSYSASVFDYWTDWWIYFKNDISNGDPVITHIEGISDNKLKGHLVIAYGWTEHSALTFPGNKFLVVADGWYNTYRVLDFNYYDTINGYRVRI